jgi:transaldolase
MKLLGASQALLAAKAGAAYISPFMGLAKFLEDNAKAAAKSR